MSDAPAATQLSGQAILTVRFDTHRQLARWAKKPRLSADQYTQHNALKRAVVVLQDKAFTHGCQLHAPHSGGPR